MTHLRKMPLERPRQYLRAVHTTRRGLTPPEPPQYLRGEIRKKVLGGPLLVCQSMAGIRRKL